MSETPEELRTRIRDDLLNLDRTPGASAQYLQVEGIIQTARIADALEAIEETGVYVYQQGTEPTNEEKAETGRRRG